MERKQISEPPVFNPNKTRYSKELEKINEHLTRMKIYGGWIIQGPYNTLFIKDPCHEWIFKSEDNEDVEVE